MQSFKLALLSLLPLAATVAGSTITIEVGDGGLIFSPNSTTAEVGDVLDFHFYPGDHSVVNGPYNTPCIAATTDVWFSGYIPGDSTGNDTTFQVTVNSTDTMWYYCATGPHCKLGMVGVINPPTTGDESLAGYRALATSNTAATAPDNVEGGVIVVGGDVSSSSSSSSISMSGSSMSSTVTGSMSMTSATMTSTMTGSATTTSVTAAATSTSAAAAAAANRDYVGVGMVMAAVGGFAAFMV